MCYICNKKKKRILIKYFIIILYYFNYITNMKRDNDEIEIKKYKTHQNSGSILALFFIIKTIYIYTRTTI